MDCPTEHDVTSTARADDGDPQVYRAPFDQSGPGTVAEAVVASVARVEDVDPTALPAVHDVVDPDALDRLFTTANADPSAGRLVVGFQYFGYHVTVRPDAIHVRASERNHD